MDAGGQKRVVVVGLARSGIAAARFLAARGARASWPPTGSRKRELPEEALRLRGSGRAAGAGRPPRGDASPAPSLVVVSPGVPWEPARARGRARAPASRCMAELELGVRCCRARWRRSPAPRASPPPPPRSAPCCARRAATCGWAATSATAADRPAGRRHRATPPSRSRCRASSSRAPSPSTRSVAVFLNLSADHLDRHASFEAYARGQGPHLRATRPSADWAVVNADDPRGAGAGAAGRARRSCRFRGPRRRPSGTAPFFGGEAARLRLGGRVETLFARDDVRGARRRTSRSTCWRRPPPRACWALRRRRSRARCAAFDGVAARAGARGRDRRAWRSSTTPRPPTWTRRSRASSPSPGPVLVILGGRYKGGDFADLAAGAGAATARPCSPSARRARRIARGALADGAGGATAASLEEAVARGLRRGGARRHRAARARPARPSTCSATTPTAADAFKDEVRALASARRQPLMAKKLASDTTLFAVTVALLGLGLVMVWSASLRAGPGGARQRLPLPGARRWCGPRWASSPWWPPCASTTASCASPRSCTRRGRRHRCCSSSCSSCRPVNDTHRWIRLGALSLPAGGAGEARGDPLPRLPPRAAARARQRVPALARSRRCCCWAGSRSSIFIQPDLGSAATLVLIGCVMLFLAGVRLRYFAALAAARPAAALPGGHGAPPTAATASRPSSTRGPTRAAPATRSSRA